jgi:hypothetical protein
MASFEIETDVSAETVYHRLKPRLSTHGFLSVGSDEQPLAGIIDSNSFSIWLTHSLFMRDYAVVDGTIEARPSGCVVRAQSRPNGLAIVSALLGGVLALSGLAAASRVFLVGFIVAAAGIAICWWIVREYRQDSTEILEALREASAVPSRPV